MQHRQALEIKPPFISDTRKCESDVACVFQWHPDCGLSTGSPWLKSVFQRLVCLKWKEDWGLETSFFFVTVFETSGHHLVSWDCAREV